MRSTADVLKSIRIDELGVNLIVHHEEEDDDSMPELLDEPKKSEPVKPLVELINFLKSEEIAGKIVADAECISPAQNFSIGFPSVRFIEETEEKLKADPEKCFAELIASSHLALKFFLEDIRDVCCEEKFALTPSLKMLMRSPLSGYLPCTAINLLNEINLKIANSLHVWLSYGKIMPVERLIESGFPVADDKKVLEIFSKCLQTYVSGNARRDHFISAVFVKYLIDHGCKVNLLADMQPIDCLFAAKFDVIHQAKITEIANLLIKNGGNVNAATTFDLAKKNNYPREILELIHPVPSKRCVIL